jgi:coenzyme F420-dependent glucose-6-phosphate dehydrogenase
VSWAETDEQALEAARKWKGSQPEETYRDDIHVPQRVYERGERETSDEELVASAIVGADPGMHAERLRELEQLGPTIVVLQNNSGADPMGAIRVYGDQVLPRLRE